MLLYKFLVADNKFWVIVGGCQRILGDCGNKYWVIVGGWRQILGGCGWLASNLGWLWVIVDGCRWLYCLVQLFGQGN